MTNRLFVGSLAYSVTDQQLQDHFAKAGTVVSAKVIIDRYSGQSKGFGFVEMTTVEEAEKAMKELDGSELSGRNIAVKEAKPQEDRSNRSFDNNRRGNDRRNDRNYDSRKKNW